MVRVNEQNDFAVTWREFAVKRGVEKSIGGNSGLCKLAAEVFDGANADAEGKFSSSFGMMTSIVGSYEDGKLAVEVQQLKGSDLAEFLDTAGPEVAMESRKRWSSFLDQATGYSAKQRGDKAKEDTKRVSKAKSTIRLPQDIGDDNEIDSAGKEKILEMIAELEQLLERGEIPSEGKVKKLNDML